MFNLFNLRKLKNKLVLGVVVLTLTVVGVGSYLYFNQKPSDAKKAEASELQAKVNAKPEAGIEAVEVAKLEKSFGIFRFAPKGLVQAELDRQLKENYITKRQHEQFLKLYDISQNQASVDFKELQQKSEKGEF